MSDKRFEFKRQKGTIGMSPTVIVDRETGVNYLFINSGYAGGLTPLLDRNGNPVITKIDASSSVEDTILEK